MLEEVKSNSTVDAIRKQARESHTMIFGLVA